LKTLAAVLQQFFTTPLGHLTEEGVNPSETPTGKFLYHNMQFVWHCGHYDMPRKQTELRPDPAHLIIAKKLVN
jgi:hypothetical protein